MDKQNESETRGGKPADRWIDEKEVAEMTGIALPTLRNHRFLGRGLPYCKLSKSIRYFRPDVVQYMEARRVSTSDAPAR